MDPKLKKYFESDHFSAYCGIELVECRPGYAKTRVKITQNHLNRAGVVHGGLIFTLADFCVATAANAYGIIALTINASINYTEKSSGGMLYAEAREIGKNKRLQTYGVNVTDEEGKLLAHFTGTSYVTRQKIEFT